MSIVFGQNQIIVGVSEFTCKGDISKADAAGISEAIRSCVAQNNKYVLIDQKLMTEILKAQNMPSFPACSKKDCLLHLGKMLSTNVMIGGDVERNGEAIKMHLVAVDVDRKEMVNTVDNAVRTSRHDFFSSTVPALCVALLDPLGKPIDVQAAKGAGQNDKVNRNDTGKKRSFLSYPYPWIGVSAIAVGGGAAYFLLSRNSRRNNAESGGDIPINDAPVRTRP